MSTTTATATTTTAPQRTILVTGATGKQGGAVVSALLASATPAPPLILAVTRDPSSASAARLQAKSPTHIRLVKGDMDDVPALFAAARAAAADWDDRSPEQPIWGVYSVQAVASGGADGADDTANAPETRQGTAMVDAALAAGVRQFVYSSVDRGGEEASWGNATPIPHFATKNAIEMHLRDKAVGTAMAWTILRPVIFYDNLEPGLQTALFLTYLRDNMAGKAMPWVATSDIGVFAAAAFNDPDNALLHNRALTLGGEAITFDQMSSTFERVTGKPAPTTFSLLSYPLAYVKEVYTMVKWFHEDGYHVDSVPALKKLNPGMLDLEGWLRTQSKFEVKSGGTK